ncbi:MAG: site-specific DNA-methyltransferase [Candidatus Hydrogenedentes bacterium]|nr:site-specific DNA-methyltransferase [Candidatus Hydrogenedentota bacterium]
MKRRRSKNPPGTVRDAIMQALSNSAKALTLREIEEQVSRDLGPTPASSVRSYLRLNTPTLFAREARGLYYVRRDSYPNPQIPLPLEDTFSEPIVLGKAKLFHGDCFRWLAQQENCSIHAVVTDPPYGLHEYSPEQQTKLREGRGGVWRIPPSFDGHRRSPLPRFTVLKEPQLDELRSFFFEWARILIPKLVPGANVIVASNPLLSYIVSGALADAGLERRGEIIRLVMTMRGGDRPKAAHQEFNGVCVLPRSMWEPWLVYRKPIEGRVQDNLRKWKTGGFRRPSPDRPFGDIVYSAPTHKNERKIAPHPSLKPQAFLRSLVRAVLPLGEGVVLDPFAGSGSTLSAAEAVGYESVGVEKDLRYFEMARSAIPALVRFQPKGLTPILVEGR